MPEVNARDYIKGVIAAHNLEKKNIKEKNNFKVFDEMTNAEWNEVIEKDLSDFLNVILA